MKKVFTLLILFFFGYTFAQELPDNQENLLLSSTQISYLRYNTITQEIFESIDFRSSVVFYVDKEFKYLYRIFMDDLIKKPTELIVDYIEYSEDPHAIIFILKHPSNFFHRIIYQIPEQSIIETVKDHSKNQGLRLFYFSGEK